MSEVGLQEFAEHNAELDALRDANQRLTQALHQTKAKTDRLVEAAFNGARDAMMAMGVVSPVPVPAKSKAGKKNEEVALWHLSDWQGSKLTASYSSDVMVERVMRFCDKASQITEIQRADHPVRECVILFGGDMVEGLFNFPQQPFEIDATLFEQYVKVARLEMDVVMRALAIYERVTVVAEWGNHGRVGSKRAAVPRSDNFDRMTYELARQMLQHETRLTWEDCPEDIQRVEIGNYRALLIHGDEIGRGGFASPTTVVGHANRWRSGSYPWEFRDVYMGHYHNHSEWALANGEGSVYQTGSTESDNRYARDTMAASAIPSQRLHFINPERGRVTSIYRVYVDEA
jgi:hypothetical protein